MDDEGTAFPSMHCAKMFKLCQSPRYVGSGFVSSILFPVCHMRKSHLCSMLEQLFGNARADFVNLIVSFAHAANAGRSYPIKCNIVGNAGGVC